MTILSKKIMITIHGNIESDMKKYVLTDSGSVLINEISTYVKKNLDNYVIYSSSELIALLTAKAIFQKTKVLTKIEKGLDNNKQLFNDSQVNVNSLNNALFIDTNHKHSTFFKEHETLVETFLRVKKILRNILLNEPSKNIVFIVSNYIGECLINCVNEYKQYELRDDMYIYSIEYKVESLHAHKSRVRIINSCLLQSTNLLRKTFFKLKREKKIIRKFSLFGCCYFQYTYTDSEEDEEEEFLSNSSKSSAHSDCSSNETKTQDKSSGKLTDSIGESTKEYLQTHLYEQEVNIDTFLTLDEKSKESFSKRLKERKKTTDLQYLKVDSFKSFRMPSKNGNDTFPSDHASIKTEEDDEEEDEEEEENELENSMTYADERREQLKKEIFQKIEKSVLKQEIIKIEDIYNNNSIHNDVNEESIEEPEHIEPDLEIEKEEDSMHYFMQSEESKESTNNRFEPIDEELLERSESDSLIDNEKLFLKIKEYQLGEKNEEYLNTEEIAFFLNLKGFTLTEEELLELSQRKIDRKHCVEQLKELIEYYKNIKNTYKKQFLSCFMNNEHQNFTHLHKDTLKFLLTNYGDKLDENECGEFFENIDVPEYINGELLFETLNNIDCSSVSQVLLDEY